MRKDSKRITVHTATYNRAFILENAYRSLCAQTNKDFIWRITDDGSSDNTETLVSKWLTDDNGFDIIYVKCEHKGIPHTLNYGIQHTNTEFFVMLDSDDYFVPNAIEQIYTWIENITNWGGVLRDWFCKMPAGWKLYETSDSYY